MADGFSFLKTAKELIEKQESGDKAEIAAKEAVGLFRSACDSRGLADALRCLVDLKIAAEDREGALRIVRDELAVAESAGDQLSKALLLTVQAEVMIHMDDPVEALSLGSAARGILQELGRKAEEANTIATSILVALCMQRKSGEAVTAANEMLTLGWQSGDRKTQGLACQCGLNAFLISGSREAVELGRRAVQIFQVIGDKEQEAASLIALANAHLHLQSPAEATRTASEAMSIVRDSGARKMFSMCFHTLIQAYVANKQGAEAIYWAEEEVAKCQKVKDTKLESLISFAVVKAYVGAGKLDLAGRKAEAFLKLFQDLGDRRGEAAMLKGLAELRYGAERYEDAKGCVNSSLVIIKDFKDERGESELLVMLDHICVANGTPEDAPHRGEALQILGELTRALEEQNGAKFRELTNRFDEIGGVTEQEIRDTFGAAVAKDPDGAKDFIVKHIGADALANAQAAAKSSQLDAKKQPGTFFKLIERNLWYTNFKKGGLMYGPRFRCVHLPVAKSSDEAYAVMRMTSESEAWEQELLLGGGPGIMDCNLQTAAGPQYMSSR